METAEIIKALLSIDIRERLKKDNNQILLGEVSRDFDEYIAKLKQEYIVTPRLKVEGKEIRIPSGSCRNYLPEILREAMEHLCQSIQNFTK